MSYTLSDPFIYQVGGKFNCNIRSSVHMRSVLNPPLFYLAVLKPAFNTGNRLDQEKNACSDNEHVEVG